MKILNSNHINATSILGVTLLNCKNPILMLCDMKLSMGIQSVVNINT